MKRLLIILLIIALILPVVPAAAQDDACGSAPPPRLTLDRYANVIAGQTTELTAEPGDAATAIVALPEGSRLLVLDGPVCVEGVYWWNATDYASFEFGWVPESANGAYILEPYQFAPAPPVELNVPMSEPVISNPQVPLPAVEPIGSPVVLEIPYAGWDWEAFIEDAFTTPPDPAALVLPNAYAGDLPVPPVDLNTVYFVEQANLTPEQLALLARNGFVVVPGGLSQFDDAYRSDSGWDHGDGKADFITTDALLHSLFLTYQNTLMFLEMDHFFRLLSNVVAGGYEAAETQYQAAVGTPLEALARKAAIYYAVPLILLGELDAAPAFGEGQRVPAQVLGQADPAVIAEARPIVDLIRQAEGRLAVPILEDYTEDFSQYQVRGYYAGTPSLEAYFRAMMWLGRITFTARSQADTQTGLLVLRALREADGAYEDWAAMYDTLGFLIGPADDLGPQDYGPLADQVFGADLPTDALADSARLDEFLAGVKALPGPRINSIPLPLGTHADEVDELTRGFRLFGQRFTFDGYIMQQLIYPEISTDDFSRALPLGLDIATVLGSDIAFTLADEAGATEYAGYTERVGELREQVDTLDANAWMENLYGSWLWTLQPLLVRDPDLVPPMMQTDAWKRKDMHSALGSWTELKYATLLYAEQPMGGLGGGGPQPPLISYSYVEPNPLVFARIAIVAATLNDGLEQRGWLENESLTQANPLHWVSSGLNSLALLSARLAEIGRREVAGEPVDYEELMFLQEHFGTALWSIRYTMEEWVVNPPETVALVTDVASNADAGTVLQVGIGDVDLIYVITNSPTGLQLTRGAVYSYYEFVNPIDERMTGDEWRALVAADQTPPRPDWIDLFYQN